MRISIDAPKNAKHWQYEQGFFSHKMQCICGHCETFYTTSNIIPFVKEEKSDGVVTQCPRCCKWSKSPLKII